MGGCWPPMDLFRSERMQLVQLIVPIESAHLTVSYLGDLGHLEFKDLNADKSPFQRTYAAQIKKCGEMARKLRFFKGQMMRAGLMPSIKSVSRADTTSMDDLEIKLGELEAELVEINANGEKLQRADSELVESKIVLQKVGDFFHAAQSRATTARHREIESQNIGEDSIKTPLLRDQEMASDPSKQIKLGFLCGLVLREKSMAFERILFELQGVTYFLSRQRSKNQLLILSQERRLKKMCFWFSILVRGPRIKF